ncbi:hypothetical protein B0H13DRAFT_2350154 [Mycena leptocephala]|nr:hypothetical protein B0H13DRAFT_2350154 [Mycena leptocephala]
MAVDTPYKDILNTNFVPSEDECRDIRSLVTSQMEELEGIADEILRAEDILNSLIRERDRLEQSIDSHRALVSGARRLPYDILQEIFTACLPSNRYPTMSKTESPLLISHICHEWRGLVLSMPRLWASLHIQDPRDDNLFDMGNYGLKSWLAKTGDLPLSLSYWMTDVKNSSSLVLSTLVECSRRWEHIQFHHPFTQHFRVLEAISVDDVPLLKTIVIDAESTALPGPMICSIWITCKIHKFSPSGRLLSGLEVLVSDQLRQLSLNDVSLAQTLAILRQCLNLETFTFTIRDRVGEVLPNSNPICMEHIRRACVVDLTKHDNTRFFDYVILPNLRSLEYRNDDSDPLGPLASIRAPDMLTASASARWRGQMPWSRALVVLRD